MNIFASVLMAFMENRLCRSFYPSIPEVLLSTWNTFWRKTRIFHKFKYNVFEWMNSILFYKIKVAFCFPLNLLRYLFLLYYIVDLFIMAMCLLWPILHLSLSIFWSYFSHLITHSLILSILYHLFASVNYYSPPNSLCPSWLISLE